MSAERPAATRPTFAQQIERTLIEPPYWYTRADAAGDYAAGIRYAQEHIDWSKVNAALIERWSTSGLAYIKRLAWKMNEAMASV